jgi:hypothetical protein
MSRRFLAPVVDKSGFHPMYIAIGKRDVQGVVTQLLSPVVQMGEKQLPIEAQLLSLNLAKKPAFTPTRARLTEMVRAIFEEVDQVTAEQNIPPAEQLPASVLGLMICCYVAQEMKNSAQPASVRKLTDKMATASLDQWAPEEPKYTPLATYTPPARVGSRERSRVGSSGTPGRRAF